MGMIALGIDPGTATTGYGVVEAVGSRRIHIEHGTIWTPSGAPVGDRLQAIYYGVRTKISRHKPDVVGVEEIFFSRNTKTAMKVAQARGVVLLAAAESGTRIFEINPGKVKQGIVGYGAADKKQVTEMVVRLLGMKSPPRPDDAADALAVAYCATFEGLPPAVTAVFR